MIVKSKCNVFSRAIFNSWSLQNVCLLSDAGNTGIVRARSRSTYLSLSRYGFVGMTEARMLLKSCHQLSLTTRSKQTDTFGLTVLKKGELMEATRKERYLIVGLGNYVYHDTRHSVGMRAADRLMTRLETHWEKNPDQLRLYDGVLGRSLIGIKGCESTVAEVFLFKPKALMNINGRSVLKAAKQLNVDANNIYLIHDELDKVVGKCSLKEGGSARGHKGVLSCYECLRKSTLWPKNVDGDFKGMTRLRIGIGRPTRQSEVVQYVLDRFRDSEIDKIDAATNEGLDLLLKHIATRITTQRQFHGKEDT